jgi:hypothetical protein
MTFQPGQSGNPSGYKASTRRKGNAEVFYEIKNRGYLDPLITLAKIQHESENESVRANAAAALAPYTHPKLQSLPVPRYIEHPIDVPEFTSVEIAEQFLAKITVLLAAGQLDLDFADSLTKTTVGWIQSQYAKQGIDLKAQAQGASSHETTIRIEGGLPALPLGPTDGPLIMPELNGQKSYEMLEHQSSGNGPSPSSSVAEQTNDPGEPPL